MSDYEDRRLPPILVPSFKTLQALEDAGARALARTAIESGLSFSSDASALMIHRAKVAFCNSLVVLHIKELAPNEVADLMNKALSDAFERMLTDGGL